MALIARHPDFIEAGMRQARLAVGKCEPLAMPPWSRPPVRDAVSSWVLAWFPALGPAVIGDRLGLAAVRNEHDLATA